MPPTQLKLLRLGRDGSWGLRLGVVLAAVALAVGLFAFRRSAGLADLPGAGQEPALTAALLESYLDTALDVRLGRREAREAGWKPATWATYPRIVAALERASWSMADYMRVEGQVNAARLELIEPGSVHDLDDPHSRPVPPEHLAVVSARLEEVSKAQGPLPD